MLLLKLFVTVSLCVIILWKGDWEDILAQFRHVHRVGIAVVFLCMVLCVTISAYKWQLLLNIHGASFAFRRLHAYYFIAMFFNNFLPTSIGGDGYRIYKTWNNPRSKTSAVISVFVERITGILSLLLLGWIGAILGYVQHGNEISRIVMLIGLVGVALSTPALLLLTNRSLARRLIGHRRLPAILKDVLEHLGDYRRSLGTSLLVIVVSLGFHLFTLAWMSLLIGSVGGDMELIDLVVVMAVVSVAAVLPISINGIGVVDGVFIYLSVQFGLDYDVALSVMLLQRALLIPISLFGGLLYLRHRREPPDARTNAGDIVAEHQQ